MPAGRPPTYRKEFAEEAYRLCLVYNSTDAQLARNFGVDELTINRWKKSHPEFCKSIKRGKEDTDFDVTKSLYKRATGYEYEEVREETMPNGKKRITKTIKHVPPDTAAAHIWRKNRTPAIWKDKHEIQHSGEIKITIEGNNPEISKLSNKPDIKHESD